MPYTHTNGVNVAKPAGSDPATVAADMRDIKLAWNERFTDVLGVNFATADPVVPTKVGPALTIQGKQIGTPIFNAGNSGASKTIDWNDGDQQQLTVNANTTLTFTNSIAGRTYFLFILQDATGNRSIALPATVRSSNGLAFSLVNVSTEASRLTIVVLTVTPYTSGGSPVLVGSVVAANVNVS